MARQRKSPTDLVDPTPKAVPRLSQLVIKLRGVRQSRERIKNEAAKPISLQGLVNIATGCAQNEPPHLAAERAWELHEACVEVYREKRSEALEKQAGEVLGRLIFPIKYTDACRLITEEKDHNARGEIKFRQCLKYYYYYHQGIVTESQIKIWQAANAEEDFEEISKLEGDHVERCTAEIKRLKETGFSRDDFRFLRKYYWESGYQRFVTQSIPVKNSNNGSAGGRGNKGSTKKKD